MKSSVRFALQAVIVLLAIAPTGVNAQNAQNLGVTPEEPAHVRPPNWIGVESFSWGVAPSTGGNLKAGGLTSLEGVTSLDSLAGGVPPVPTTRNGGSGNDRISSYGTSNTTAVRSLETATTGGAGNAVIIGRSSDNAPRSFPTESLSFNYGRVRAETGPGAGPNLSAVSPHTTPVSPVIQAVPGASQGASNTGDWFNINGNLPITQVNGVAVKQPSGLGLR